MILKTSFYAIPFCLGALLASMASPAWAQHAGDIEVEIESGTLHTHGSIFEGDFFNTTISFETDEPGIDSEIGTFNSGDQLGFNVLQSLWYWDGTALASPLSTTSVEIHGTGLDLATVTPSSGLVSGFTIGTANLDGVIHKHLDFELNPHPAADVGAYGLVLELTSPSYQASDPFLIVLNNGLIDNAQFEAGVDAIAVASGVSPVPEPSSLVLAALGLAGLGWFGVRRKK